MEKVFALPTATINTLVKQGVHSADEAALLSVIAQQGAYYDRTDALENNKELKQIIPYVTAMCNGKILVYQRTPKQTDKRLHAKYSIGFGGHINPEDAQNGQNPVLGARTRELNEEISFGGKPQFKFFGTINIAHTPIDQFHMGFAYLAELPNEEYTINEIGYFASTAWLTPTELATKYEQMEAWSQVLFSALYPNLITASV